MGIFSYGSKWIIGNVFLKSSKTVTIVTMQITLSLMVGYKAHENPNYYFDELLKAEAWGITQPKQISIFY